MRSGDLHLASEAIDSVSRKKPHLTPLRTAKAKLLITAGEQNKALAEIEAALSFAPANVELNVAAARIAVDMGSACAVDYAQRRCG